MTIRSIHRRLWTLGSEALRRIRSHEWLLTGPIIAPVLLAIVGCNPNTTRPPQVEPVTGAVQVQLSLPTNLATQELADQLKIDTIPITVVRLEDGYLETPWFDAITGQATEARPLGPNIVRLRAWINPASPQHSYLTVEVVYRLLADPSRPGRALDRQVPNDNPAAQRTGRALEVLSARYPPRVG